DDLGNRLTRCVKKNSVHQFLEIFFVEISLIVLIGHMDLHLLPGKNLLVERRLHRESCPQQTETPETGLFSTVGRGLHDADERKRRSALNLIEDDVWGVRGQEGEVRTGRREFLQL